MGGRSSTVKFRKCHYRSASMRTPCGFEASPCAVCLFSKNRQGHQIQHRRAPLKAMGFKVTLFAAAGCRLSAGLLGKGLCLQLRNAPSRQFRVEGIHVLMHETRIHESKRPASPATCAIVSRLHGLEAHAKKRIGSSERNRPYSFTALSELGRSDGVASRDSGADCRGAQACRSGRRASSPRCEFTASFEVTGSTISDVKL